MKLNLPNPLSSRFFVTPRRVSNLSLYPAKTNQLPEQIDQILNLVEENAPLSLSYKLLYRRHLNLDSGSPTGSELIAEIGKSGGEQRLYISLIRTGESMENTCSFLWAKTPKLITQDFKLNLKKQITDYLIESSVVLRQRAGMRANIDPHYKALREQRALLN